MKLSSKSVTDGQVFNSIYTCEGQDISPALSWDKAPNGTKTFALIVDDPDAPVGTWVHWLAYNISASTTSLPEAITEEALTKLGISQGMNDFKKVTYGGPCPPRGHGMHHYHFKLYALDIKLEFSNIPHKKDIEKAMEGHVLAQSEIVPIFKRD